MVERIGIADATLAATSARVPTLLVLAGTSGVGKSSTARNLVHERNVTRTISTDAIREVLRTTDPERTLPALHRSSFSLGSAGDPVLDWLETCDVLEQGVRATMDRARREGVDLLIEGVHLVPSSRLLQRWREEGGIAVGVVLRVEDEARHRAMLREREEASWRRADRYIASLDRIRAIQDGLVDRAKVAGWPVIDVDRVNEVDRIQHHLNLAWNDARRP
jgi:2-phosphoglycerate kinase